MRTIKFHERLYLSESIDEQKLGKIKRRLHYKPLLANVYLIVPSSNPDNQLDIFDARQLAQKYYNDASFFVIGIAGDYNEALSLIERMAQECFEERGDCKLREYLLC